MSGKLILIKHSLPIIDENLPSNLWVLSQEGKRRCIKLAELLSAHRADLIVSSTEPKAVATGERISGILGVPFAIMEGLQEHERSKVGILNEEVFQRSIELLFKEPDSLVFGGETAAQAGERFYNAVISLVENPEKTIAVVSHGTVISLFIERTNQIKGYNVWLRLGLPSFVVLNLPEFGIYDSEFVIE